MICRATAALVLNILKTSKAIVPPRWVSPNRKFLANRMSTLKMIPEEEAVDRVIHERLQPDDGGVIAVDRLARKVSKLLDELKILAGSP